MPRKLSFVLAVVFFAGAVLFSSGMVLAAPQADAPVPHSGDGGFIPEIIFDISLTLDVSSAPMTYSVPAGGTFRYPFSCNSLRVVPQWDVPEGEAGRTAIIPTDLKITWSGLEESSKLFADLYPVFRYPTEAMDPTCEFTGMVGSEQVKKTAVLHLNPVPATPDTRTVIQYEPASGTAASPAKYTILKGEPVGFKAGTNGQIEWTLTDPLGITRSARRLTEFNDVTLEDKWWDAWIPQEAGTYTLSAVLRLPADESEAGNDAIGSIAVSSEAVWEFKVVDSYVSQPEVLEMLQSTRQASAESDWSMASGDKVTIWSPDREVYLRAVASTANDPSLLQYQWMAHDPGQQDFADVPGGNDPVLAISPADITEREYQCTITNRATGESAVSRVITLQSEQVAAQKKNVGGVVLSDPAASPSALLKSTDSGPWYNPFMQCATTQVQNGETVTFSAVPMELDSVLAVSADFDLSTIEYIWMSAPSASGPFTPVAGADLSSPTLTVQADAQTAGLFYRVVLRNTAAHDPEPFATNAIGIKVEGLPDTPPAPSDTPLSPTLPQPAAGSGVTIADGPQGFGKVLTGIDAGSGSSFVSIAQVLAKFTVPEGASVEIIGTDGLACDPTAPVCTGNRVLMTDAEGVRQTVTVVVSGDVTGSGIINIAQLTRMAQALTGARPLTGAFLAAGDLTGTGSISIADLVKEANMLTGA